MAPRCVTDSVSPIVFPMRLTGSDNVKEFPLLLIEIDSVFSGFSMSLLFPIHTWMASGQITNSVIHELKCIVSFSIISM